jgi:hypothetical protein
VALRTPPRPLVLPWAEPQPIPGFALDRLIEDVIAATGPELLGLLGATGVVELFARCWTGHAVRDSRRACRWRSVFELTVV